MSDYSKHIVAAAEVWPALDQATVRVITVPYHRTAYGDIQIDLAPPVKMESDLSKVAFTRKSITLEKVANLITHEILYMGYEPDTNTLVIGKQD